MEHVGVAALVEIVLVRLKQDGARCFYELRVVHMPSLRMTNIGGARRISIIAGAYPLRNGTLQHTVRPRRSAGSCNCE